MEKEDYIAVTHFINPQLFWYHKIDVQSPGFKELQRIEESVQLLYTAKQSATLLPYRPIVGEIVAIAFVSWNKFIRARVEYIAKYTKAEDEFVVWALDYGFPFQTKLMYIRKLPESFSKETDHIKRGGIANLNPVEMEFDFPTATNNLKSKKSWSKKAVSFLEKIINDAASISFIEMFAIDGGQPGIHHFGDLKIVNHKGLEIMASDYLLKMDTAVKCRAGFRETIKTFRAINIPCWQTNSGDMDIIENKLNTLNLDFVNQRNFQLSGNVSEISCDNFAKQKVMDWCERNQNLDRTMDNVHRSTPLNEMDASDISFDDSVSVKNYRNQGVHGEYDDSFMGHAGALHESRRKKYEGKLLPPKPSPEVFDVIPEHSKHSKSQKDENSSESAASATSQRTKALLELRKKLQKVSLKEEKSCKDDGSQKSDLQSEAGTEEFLEVCRERNAHSTRLAKLKELRARRNVIANNSGDQSEENENANQEKIDDLQSKQSVTTEKSDYDKAEGSFLGSQTESVVSIRASRLISMRKKIKEKYNQESQSTSHHLIEKNSSENDFYEGARKKDQVLQQNLSLIDNVLPNEDASHKAPTSLIEGIFPAQVKENNYKTQQHKPKFPANANKSDLLKDNVPRSSTAREAELQNLRKIVRSNPFQVMTMVPGGFDVTKLDKRHNEEHHWHTKKTTLNESGNFSPYSSAEYHSVNNSNGSSQSRSVPRRTEHVEEQNFRLTRSRKERKKSEAKTLDETKNILDESITDDSVPAPTILPKAITPKPKREVPTDLINFIDNGTLSPTENDPEIGTNSCKEAKLIDLSDIGENLNGSSHELSVEPTDNTVSAKDANAVANVINLRYESFDLMRLESPEKKSTSKSPEKCSEKAPENRRKESERNEPGRRIRAEKSEDCTYDACSSSTSLSTDNKSVIAQVPLSEKQHISKSSSYSSSESSASIQPLLKSSLAVDESQKAAKVDTEKQHQSSSSSLSSFVKVNRDQAPDGDTPSAMDYVCLPPVTSKWRGTNRNSSGMSNKTASSSGHETESDGNTFTNEANIRLPQVAGESLLKTNLIDHLVLAHSHAKVSPIENMTSAMFAPVVHREMENMRLTKMYRIQSYGWAHLIRGNSFFVVNPARTGKSWCYLPPICSMVSYRTESDELPQSYGPVAIIIAPSSVQVENISRQCRRLLASSATKISVVASYAFRNSEDVKIELHNGCGILIITPPSLRRLLIANESEHLLNMERIQFVVLDDEDKMTTHYSEFNETLNKFLGPVLRQEGGKVNFQMVVTSKRWSHQMINLLKISNQPMLCIGDFLEAAVYAKSKISIKLQSKSEKMSVMIKLLEKCSYSLERVVIVCNSINEVDDIERNLIDGGLTCLPFTERTPVEYQNLIHEWKIKPISHEILVTMDSVLPELMIQNATILIHYSMPRSWTKFNFRFSVFLQKHHNLIKNAFEKPSTFVKSIVLLDEENNVQLPRLMEFMKQHDQLKHIHPDILSVASRVTAEREEARVKNGILMCPNVLEFGSCDESNRCSHRHQLTKYDVPLDEIPTEGEVRLKILDVISPTHYLARLLSHQIDGTWKEIRRSNEVTRFLMQMLMHFSNESAQVIHWPLKVSDMCVYKSDDTFHRCRILDVPPIMYENIVKVVNVKVKLIDTGSVVMCKSNSLLVMPEKFSDFPAQAVDIRLSGVKPFDNERSWDSRSTRTVKNWIMTEVGKNDCLQGSINFALMDTIWVHNVVLMEKLESIRGYAIKVNVKRSLIGKEFAIADDEEHLVKQIAQQNGLLKRESKTVKETAQQPVSAESPESPPCVEENLMEFSASEGKEASFDSGRKSDVVNINASVSPQKETSIEEPSDKPPESWVQLRLDELRKVQIGEFNDPEQFYVCLVGKEQQDYDLNELRSLIKQQKKKPLESPHPMQDCLAPHDGVYARAKIQRLEVNSLNGQVQARIFFCDLGLFRNLELGKLRCSNKEITEFMPFQAICCKLTGILPKTAGKEIQSLIPKKDCTYFAYTVKEIFQNVIAEEDFHMNAYEIILYESFPQKYDLQINKLLVEKGLADYDFATKHILDNDSKASFTKADDASDEETGTFDFQQLLDHMQAILDEEEADNINDEAEDLGSDMEVSKENPCKVLESTEDESDYSKLNDPVRSDLQMPALKTLYSCPHTTWYETMCMIYLVIQAPDITDYYLDVSPKRLMFSASVRGEVQVLVLHFLGYVEPDQTTHEIRGLSVVVRLVKSVYMKWPRLLETSTKYPWLTYNLDAIDTFQAEEMIETDTNRPRKRAYSISSDLSDSSDSNPCETFTPIVNTDQIFDPAEELF